MASCRDLKKSDEKDLFSWAKMGTESKAEHDVGGGGSFQTRVVRREKAKMGTL